MVCVSFICVETKWLIAFAKPLKISGSEECMCIQFPWFSMHFSCKYMFFCNPLQKILMVLSFGRYPKALDSVLEKHLEDCTDEADQNLFHQFISLSLSCGKYKVGRIVILALIWLYCQKADF